MVAAGAKSTAVLTSDAEIVPYARARLTAALETVPHAPRARWRWVAVHRCPRAIAKATCRALMRRCPVQRRERLAGVRADTQHRAAGP